MGHLGEGHIVKRYDGELKNLHYLTLEMGEVVLNQLGDALEAFKHGDIELARKVVDMDNQVDYLEVSNDDQISQLLARRCPVSSDLRLVIAVSKSVSDLERIGDEAVRIAGLVIDQYGRERGESNGKMLRDVQRMGEMAMASLRNALNLFEVWDEDSALKVIANYRDMDEEFQSDLRRLITYIMEDYRNIGMAVGVVLVIKALERIGHHAQNLAEYVILHVKGEDIRHRQP